MTRRVLPALLALATTAACATKKDLTDLRSGLTEELRAIEAGQDSVVAEIRGLRAVLLDSLTVRERQLLRGRGELNRQLRDLLADVARLTELVGHNQRALDGLGERVDRLVEAGGVTGSGAAGAPPADSPGGGTEGSEGGSEANPGALYEASLQQFRRGSHETARAGLREFLQLFPDHELAPDALYYVAETYARSGEPDRALRSYARVVQLYPNSRRASTALYKSGLVELERGNVEEAREFFSRVVRGYPESDEAGLARERLRALEEG